MRVGNLRLAINCYIRTILQCTLRINCRKRSLGSFFCTRDHNPPMHAAMAGGSLFLHLMQVHIGLGKGDFYAVLCELL